MTDTREPLPDGDHRPVPVYRNLGGYTTVTGQACEACSRTRQAVVLWPCAVVTVEPTSDADLDRELRDLTGT